MNASGVLAIHEDNCRTPICTAMHMTEVYTCDLHVAACQEVLQLVLVLVDHGRQTGLLIHWLKEF